MELQNFTNLFSNLQDYVSQILNADEILQQMGASFISENSLDIEYELKNALNRQGLACAVMTPRAQYQGHNGIEQIFTCDELTLQIVENPIVNRARLKKAGLEHGTALDVAKAASDRLSGPQGGYFGKFTTKRIQESEVGGLLVVTATFGCTVYDRLSAVPSGDISGNWVEVPFVRVSELSGWLDDWLSSNISSFVDLEPYRQKTDLSTYTYQWTPWTYREDRELEYAGYNDMIQSYVWSYRHGINLGWRHLSYFAGDDQNSPGWYISIGSMPFLGNYLGGEWDDLVLDVPEQQQSTWGEHITRTSIGGLVPDGDRFALSSELADLSGEVASMYSNEQIDGMLDKKRGKGDLSVYSETEPYVPTGDMIAKLSDIPEVPYVNYNKFRQKDDLSTYTKTVLPWTIDPPTLYGDQLTWRPESEWWCNNASVSSEWDAGTVALKWDGQKWMYLLGTQYIWEDIGSTDPKATQLSIEVDPQFSLNAYNLTRTGYDDIYTPDGDKLLLSSEVYSNGEIDQMMGKKRGLSDLNVYSETEPYTPTGDTLATKSLVAATSVDLSVKLQLKDWQNYALSSEWYSGKTMIRTYDGRQYWVDLSSTNIINISTFQRQGFNFTDDPVSGIMDIAFGRGIFPHNTINMASSKVKHVWYPSHLTAVGQNCFNNCSELETVLLGDYDPGEMAKTLKIGHRAFRNCQKLSRVEMAALSVTLGGSQLFDGTPLSASSEWTDLEPGLWMYGWMKGETDAKQNLSSLLNLPEDVIHVGYPRKEESHDYLPLSGDATANVVTNSLSANAVVNEDPNTSDTIGPDEGGNHYGGVLIRDGTIDIQKSIQHATVDWFGTKIQGTGRITLKEKNADDPVITYDELILPKTQSQSTRTIATQEWTNDIVGDISTLIHNT